MKSKLINWGDILSNSKVLDAYLRFSEGKSSCREITNEFKNTEFAGSFRNLIRRGGAVKAKRAAREALRRRALI